MEIDGWEAGRALPDYEVGRELGRGQYGVVWEGRHRHLRRRVAIKQLIDAPGTDSADARARFRREARILAGLDHPHVVTVYDYREDGDLRLLVIEHLDGGSLADRRRAGMDGPAQLASMVAAATGLHHVHLSGVLHRDVKPENMLFDGRRALKVTDFGVARGDGARYGTVTATSVGLSQAGQFFGTPAYVSPEQAEAALTGRDLPIGPAADQYGLAAVYFEMLTGTLTHDPEGGFLGLCNRRIAEPAPRARDLVPDLHPAIDDVVAVALARRPEERYVDLEALSVALVRAGNAAYGVGWLDDARIDLRDTGQAWREAQAGTPPPPPRVHAAPAISRVDETTRIERPGPAGAAATTLPSGAPAAPPALPPPPEAPLPPPPSSADVPSTPTAGPRRTRRMTMALVALAVAAVLVTVGVVAVIVGDDDRGGAGEAGGSTEAPPPAPGTVAMRLEWSDRTGDDVFSSPTVDGDRVVVGSDDGSVYSLDAESGDRVWAVPTGAAVQSSVAVADADGDGLYVVGNDAGKVLALGRDGEARWTFDVRAQQSEPATTTTDGSGQQGPDPYRVLASPAIVDDVVVVAADKVYGVGLDDGQRRWERSTGAGVVATPAVEGSTVVVADTRGTVTALDALTGEVRWTTDEPSGTLLSSPRIVDGTVVVVDGAGVLWLLDLDGGEPRRHVDLGSPVYSSPAIADGMAYVGTNAGAVRAVPLDESDEGGWESVLPLDVQSSPTVVDGLVVVGCNDGHVYGLDAATGERVSSYRTGGTVLSSPRPLGDGVVVGSADGEVRALTDLHG